MNYRLLCSTGRLFIFTIFLCMPVMSWSQYGSLKAYDVEVLYSVQNVTSGTIAITKMGQTEEIEKILVPMKLNPGTYKVNIKRIDSNIYEIVGGSIYIKTRYCYEYTYGEDAILDINTSYGFNIGKLIFE